MQAKIDKLSKEVKSLNNHYVSTDGAIQSMKGANYTKRSDRDYPVSDKKQGIDTRLDRMKNFLLAKYCGEIAPEHKQILNDLEYDVEKNVYLYKGKRIDPKLLEGKKVKHVNKKIAENKDKILGAILTLFIVLLLFVKTLFFF